MAGHGVSVGRWLGLLGFLLLGLWACGGRDGGDGSGAVDPSQVRHADLARGFWVAVSTDVGSAPFTQEILHFTTVNEARTLYGELGVLHGTGGNLLQTIDQSLDWFQSDDPIVLTFGRGGGQIWEVVAVRVAGGNVGWSPLGFVGFDYGFAPPVERRIHRFVRGEELVLGLGDGTDLAFTYRWVEDCRWNTASGWTFVRAVIDGLYNPWFSVGMTRGGDIVGGFPPERNSQLQMVVWGEDMCPVYGRNTSLPMGAGAQLVSDGADGLIGVRRTPAGFSTIHLRPGQPMARTDEADAMEQTPVEQLHRLPDGRVVFLETDLRLDRSQQAAARWVAAPGQAAEAWPLPPLPGFDNQLHVRLRPDGRAFITWQELIRGEGRRGRLQLEGPDGAWTDLPLQATTAEGRQLDLIDHDWALGPAEVDAAGRVVVMLPAEAVVEPVHIARPLPRGARALVRMHGGRAEVRMLPSGEQGRTFRTHMSADGTWRGFGEFGPADAEGTELEILTWPVDGDLEILRPGLITRSNLRGLHGFWDLAWYLGTYIWHRRHVAVEDNGSILLSDGWSAAMVRPPDALYRPQDATITLAMPDAPAGARLESLHAPRVTCESTCDITAELGTVVGLRVVSPPGWVLDGTETCGVAALDAGFCSVTVRPGWTCPEGYQGEPSAEACEPRRTYPFRWRRTPALALADARLPGWWGPVVADADGGLVAILQVTSGVLPDGTEVEGGDNTDPIPVVTRWTGTTMRWAAPLPRWAQLDALQASANGGVLVVLSPPRGRTLELPETEGGAPQPLADGVRAVVHLAADDGRLLRAPRFAMPAHFTPRAHAVTSAGDLLSFGYSFNPRVGGGDPGESAIPLDHELLLRHRPDGSLDVLHQRPETRGGSDALLSVHPGGRMLMIREEGGTAFWQAFGVDASPAAGQEGTLALAGRRVIELRAVPVADGWLLAATGGGAGAETDRPVLDGREALMVVELDSAGSLRRIVELPMEPGTGSGMVMGLTKLPDGRIAAAVRRGTAGWVEALLLEGSSALNMGFVSTQTAMQEGFVTAALVASPDGTLTWAGRPWEQAMVLRPFLLRGTFVARFDPALWDMMAERMPSQADYFFMRQAPLR